MKITITGKNFNTNQYLEDTIAKKFEKLDKYFSEDIDAKIMLSQERNKDKIEVSINAKGAQFRTDQVADDIHEGIDRAVDKLASQISKFKGKLQKKYQDNKSVRFEAIPEPDEETDKVGSVVRTKNIELTPMSVEEAMLQMEMASHDFFVFLNADTGKTEVIYKRNDGDYGVLATAE